MPIKKYPQNFNSSMETDPLAVKLADVENSVSTSTTKVPTSGLLKSVKEALETLIAEKATPAQITTAINNLVDSAPGALDTLNELAAALGDDADFATTITNALAGKQATLVAGTNIKTINSNSLLGSGNIAVQEPLVSATNIKTINGSDILGAGDLVVGGNVSVTAGESVVSGNIGYLRNDGKAYKYIARAIVSGSFSQNWKVLQAIALSDNKLFLLYGDVANSNYLTSVIANYNATNNTFSFGSPVVVQSVATTDPITVYLFKESSTKVVIANLNSTTANVRVGTIDGSDVITLGTAATISNAGNYSVHYDSTTNVYVVCTPNTTNSQIYGVTISGTTATAGSANTVSTLNAQSKMYGFHDNISGYNYLINTNGGTAGKWNGIQFTMSGGTATFPQSDTTFRDIYVDFAQADSSGTSSQIKRLLFKDGFVYITVTYNGATAIFKAKPSVDALLVVEIVSGRLSSNYYPLFASADGMAVVGKGALNPQLFIKDAYSTIAFDIYSIFTTALIYNFVEISTNNLMIFDYETSGTTAKYIYVANTFRKGFIGIFNATASADASVAIIPKNQIYTTTGLTAGATYYVQNDGSFSTTPSQQILGSAISTTQLLVGA